jgi:glyoxylase-like metal-dependent hydrolase (beta-lactamase superfamily II)
LILERSTHPGWLSNAYLIADETGGNAVVVDSGASLEPFFERLEWDRLTLAAILTTHRHADHTGGHAELVRRTGAPIFALRDEVSHVDGAQPLEHGEERVWGKVRVRTIHLPGHTAGQAGFLIEDTGLFTGDCLFAGSIGGTVGPAASGFEDARTAIDRILALPDDTTIHPGHAGPTTVGRERAKNPFIRVMTGAEPEGFGRCVALGRQATLVVLARDYDGGSKAWVRFLDDGRDAIVPGSRIEVRSMP